MALRTSKFRPLFDKQEKLNIEVEKNSNRIKLIRKFSFPTAITNKSILGAITEPKRAMNELIESAELRIMVGYDSTMMM